MTDEDPFADQKCEHGCWEPLVWKGIMEGAQEKVRDLEKLIMTVRSDTFSTEHAEHYMTYLTGRIQGLKDVLSMAEGQRMMEPGIAGEARRYM